MALTPGTRLGVYEITAQIGEGGMGQVYRATDTKLKRQVAIKILPPSLSADPDRLARFQREAEVLASLNHPNIAIIHGLEESGGVRALVMELVEGEDLSQRIAGGAIPLDEALPIAKQIAEALEAAHEQGIIHRDLKPANIKVRPDGAVKVLDFGLAKAMEPVGASPSVSQSPTITTPAMTQAGMILGTAAYMSPEQACGRTVDKRADVWAFGAVLFEMLAGRRCFQGDDVSDTFAALLRANPNWSALPPETPPAIRRLLRRSLEKDVRARLSDMAMVRVELRDADTEPREDPAAASTVRRPRASALRRVASYAAVVVAVGVVTALVTPAIILRVRERVTKLLLPAEAPRPLGGTPEPLTRLVELTRDGARSSLAEITGMAWFPRFSPDGSRVAYGVSAGGDLNDASDLWVLDVARGARTRVTFAANNRFYPIWTRDGTRLTHADGSGPTNRLLWTLADGSGGTETLLDVGTRRFPTSWSPDGHVLAIYANGPTNTRDLWMLHVGGDKPAPTLFVETPFQERGAIFSPDGRWVAYVSNKSGQNDIYARPYPGPGGEVTISVSGGQEPVWAPSGRELFYRHDAKLLVVRVDQTALSLTVGAPTRVFDDPYRLDTGGAQGGVANYDISPNGQRFVMVEEPRR